MNRTILLLLTFFVQIVTAQTDYRPLLEDGKVWTVNSGNAIDEPLRMMKFVVAGDTVCEGETFKKINWDYYGIMMHSNQLEHVDSGLYCLMQEKGKKVYGKLMGDKNPRLFYDFSMEVGDTMKYEDRYNKLLHQILLTKIDTIEVRGNSYRRFHLQNLDSGYHEGYQDGLRSYYYECSDFIWVEGIGSPVGFLNPFPSLPEFSIRSFYSCSDDTGVLFFKHDFFYDPISGTNQNDYITSTYTPLTSKKAGVGVPVLTSSAKTKSQVYYNGIPENARIVKMAFRGYNEGEDVTRHAKVYFLETSEAIKQEIPFMSTSDMTCVFDGDCVIKHGGTTDQHEEILEIELKQPFVCHDKTLYVIMEFSGEAKDYDVYFEQDMYSKCTMATSDDPNENLPNSSMLGNMPCVVFTIQTPMQHLSGRVVDQTGQPVIGAKVQMGYDGYGSMETVYEGTTDATGYYDIRVENTQSTYNIVCSALGHLPFRCRGIDYNQENVSEMNFMLFDRVTFPAGQRCTIVLPVKPDASAGRYYRLYEEVADTLFFLREPNPKANLPYIFFPERDYLVEVANLDLSSETVEPSTQGVSFCGMYYSSDVGTVHAGNYGTFILDKTPGCSRDTLCGLHAYFDAYMTSWKALQEENFKFFEQEPKAEGYISLLKDGRTWNYTSATGNFREFIDGDTLIAGEIWKKIFIEKPLGTPAVYEKAMREQGRRVYAMTPHINDINVVSYLFADYSLDTEDKLDGTLLRLFWDRYSLTVAEKDSIQSCGRLYPQLKLEQHIPNESSTGSTTWIEGIGGDCGIYNAVLWSNGNLAGLFDPTAELLTCYDGDVCIYNRDDVSDKTNSIISRKLFHSQGERAIFDLQGRRLSAIPAKGLYIKDGKKYMK